MPIDPRTPVIVGVGQKTSRKDSLPGPEPLLAWEQAVRAAAEDGGIASAALTRADMIGVVDLMSWTYDDAPARLAAGIGADPHTLLYSRPGGTAAHKLLFAACEAIWAGKSDLAVIAGGESFATRKWIERAGIPVEWSHPAPPDRPSALQPSTFQHPSEVALGLYEGVGAVYIYALHDTARRAHLKIPPQDYLLETAQLCAGMSNIAAKNPDAWFPQARDAAFLLAPGTDNRMIAYPYRKHMIAIMDVDIAAACILTSEENADRLGVPRDRRIYPWAGSYAMDPAFTATRRDLWRSAAMQAAADALKEAAGVTIDQVTDLDLYSCFPSATRFGCDALGLDSCAGERTTVTGGLPYAGGPGNSYMMTSIVKMTQRLRAKPDGLGIVSGVGYMMQTHAFGLYSASPPPPSVKAVDGAAVQARVDAIPLVPVDDGYRGPVTVAAYTIKYDRAGEALHGAALCDLPGGWRAHAFIRDPALIREAEEAELVGRSLELAGDGPIGELR